MSFLEAVAIIGADKAKENLGKMSYALKVLGAERTPQTLIKLQELKYNRDSTAYALLRREKATISDIKFKTWMS